MSWENVARVVSATRHPLTLVGAVVIALVETRARNEYINYSGSWTTRHFVFVLALALVALAIAFTALLTLAETKAAIASQPDLPEARARRRVAPSKTPPPAAAISAADAPAAVPAAVPAASPPAATVRPTAASAPRAEAPNPGEEPSLLT